MQNQLLNIAWMMMLLPLIGALIAGLFGKKIGRKATHWVTITLVGLSFLLASYLFVVIDLLHYLPVEGVIYRWITSGVYEFNVALLIDQLSALMAWIVTFVSLVVHIYTIGYMKEDPGYQRFFSYVSLFTFAMLSLVLANNFLLMFFGWEGVGLVSYLLIGFWFDRESAVFGGLKAFMVNRVGDVGFVLAIAAVLKYFNTLNFHTIFSNVAVVVPQTIAIFPHTSVSVISLICILLFIGAMGKSAQVPLHVWLPESMEGPTPISALIHAATMVTAGIYMIARMSPLFEHSISALSLILVLGGTTCLFMGILAVTQYDIKRVIAYSTLSQLGYMAIALGASAYNAAIFHLLTHAFFKALLFLAAGSVIIALHHEQDMRKMGGLAPFMPITYLTFLIGALALSAIPPFAGFYSKDIIIEALHLSQTPGAGYAYFCAMVGAFITPLYIFRALFLTFHGKKHASLHHVAESSWVVLIPLIALAIPSLIAGALFVGPLIFSSPTLLGNSVFTLPEHDVLLLLGQTYQGAKIMALKASHTFTFWLSVAGIIAAWLFNMEFKTFTKNVKVRWQGVYHILLRKYGFDDFNQIVFVHGARKIGDFFYYISDLMLIDGLFVNGSGKFIRWFANTARKLQTGYLYHYALVMTLGLIIFLSWFLFGF